MTKNNICYLKTFLIVFIDLSFTTLWIYLLQVLVFVCLFVILFRLHSNDNENMLKMSSKAVETSKLIFKIHENEIELEMK